MTLLSVPDSSARPAAAALPFSATLDRSYDNLRLRAVTAAAPIDGLAVDASSWPYAVVHIVRGSATCLIAGERRSFGEGDVLVLQAADVRRLRTVDGVLLVAHVPGDALGPAGSQLRRASGHAAQKDLGVALLVAQLLQGLADQPDDYAPENACRLVQHIVGLIALMCTEIATAHEPQPESLLQLAQEFIEENLADVDLSPDRIAGSIHVSTRTLHRLFESEGLTVTGWIRARRLEHCRAELADAATADIPVSGIGARWGLWDAAHFSRVFKSCFGMSPRVYRTAAALGHA